MAKSASVPENIGGSLQLAYNDQVTKVVFTGPSLAHEAIGAVPPDTKLLPPIKRGDVDEAVQVFPNLKAIGVVDGQFFQSFSISPKEILASMDRGKRLFGSSSMGALRATELNIYGMVGVGRIYQMFASGEIDADDEVAMTYDPSTLKSTSEPLINVRIALSCSCEQEQLRQSVKETAIRIAKDLYYPDRTYRALLAHARAQLSDEDFIQLQNACKSPPNAKCEDAWRLLAEMGIVNHGERIENCRI